MDYSSDVVEVDYRGLCTSQVVMPPNRREYGIRRILALWEGAKESTAF